MRFEQKFNPRHRLKNSLQFGHTLYPVKMNFGQSERHPHPTPTQKKTKTDYVTVGETRARKKKSKSINKPKTRVGISQVLKILWDGQWSYGLGAIL